MHSIIEATPTSRLTMHEHGDGSGVIVQSTDVSAALARNEALRRAGMTKTAGGDHYMASIPLDLLNAWGLRKYGVGWEIIAADNAKLDEFLAENTVCRIHQGRN
ncbi:hypothetical protein QPK31_23255 [Massilia sp. YIM B02769]|uniref:hypothetical protein n=1 Tax=Massilia sp. YIM B02769 TaxID=3050129 RepID=UPI0025B70C66|nr:hypothetical protein [Massilia sp. YIM B02769]MDN4061141.1 hypothetical protein [Massilia sp. YIM B02769]